MPVTIKFKNTTEEERTLIDQLVEEFIMEEKQRKLEGEPFKQLIGAKGHRVVRMMKLEDYR